MPKLPPRVPVSNDLTLSALYDRLDHARMLIQGAANVILDLQQQLTAQGITGAAGSTGPLRETDSDIPF